MSANPTPSLAGAIIAGAWLSWASSAPAADGIENPAPAVPATVPLEETQTLSEIVVHSTEPRYVAPTHRDQIGRIWAPVYLNGQGPFRLVLDSGASRSGITEQVATSLGLALDRNQHVLLRGVTGAQAVPTVHVNSFAVGDLQIGAERLPILADAFGGAEGVLSTEGMANRRIYIDFRHDLISISRSHGDRADSSYRVVPFQTMRGSLLVVDATVGNIRTKAIIDTGSQVTIANLALRQALGRSAMIGRLTQIEGVTTDIQEANAIITPPLRMNCADPNGDFIEVHYHDVNYGDMRIFEHWRLTGEPAMLVGMDALGLLDILVIDYRRHELQIRTHGG
jgi:hypothetical protein